MLAYLEVYFGSHRIALAVVSLLAIVSGLGGFVESGSREGVVVVDEDPEQPATAAGGVVVVCGAVVVIGCGQLHMSVLV